MAKTDVRTNELWLEHLRHAGAIQEAALSDLRRILIRALGRSLADLSARDETFLEDAVQDALVLILKRLSQFEGRSQFLTWAISITINVAMSALRRKNWQDVSLEQITADGWRAPEAGDDQAADFERESVRSRLIQEMQALIVSDLTDKQRVALISELKGMPQDEIARRLGSNRNAVYKLTHDARKRLKQGLEASGFGRSDIQAGFAN